MKNIKIYAGIGIEKIWKEYDRVSDLSYDDKVIMWINMLEYYPRFWVIREIKKRLTLKQIIRILKHIEYKVKIRKFTKFDVRAFEIIKEVIK